MNQYDHEFYDVIAQGCIRSAEFVAPIVHDIVQPDTVIDFGCGEGHWLSAFGALGCSRVTGLDGPYVDPARLVIPQAEFHPTDFDRSPDIDLGRYDLAMSLEVAEHISAARADWFVDQLCRHADVVLFSAAIPGQGGTGHVNEQWPMYWAEKFMDRGFLGTGGLRWLLWNEAPDPVENWYAQNLLLFARAEAVMARPALEEWFIGVKSVIFPVVHPVLWDSRR